MAASLVVAVIIPAPNEAIPLPGVELPVRYRLRRGGRSKVSGTVRGTRLATCFILFVTLRYAFRRKESP
jgi:hypothetical protein